MTWALVQHPNKNSSTFTGVNSVPLTVTALGAGHLLIAVYLIFDGTTTASAPTGGGTWVHAPGCVANDGSRSTDVYYCLSATGGVTTITGNLSALSTGDFEVLEYSSTTTFALDNVNAATNGTLVGPTVTLTGSNDVVVQGLVTSSGVTAASAPYTNPGDFFGTDDNACVGAINTASGVGPTYTGGNASGAFFGIAFKETAAANFDMGSRSAMACG